MAVESGHRGPGQGHRRGSIIESDRKDYVGQKARLIICKHTLKFSNYVLVSIFVNNYNYEQPIALFVILLALYIFTIV